MRAILLSIGLAALAVVASALVVYGAARSWSSFSDHWFVLACCLPVAGVLGGFHLAGARHQMPVTGGARFLYLLPFVIVGALFCSLAGYVTFVVTSATWHEAELAARGIGLLDAILHPGVLPSFSQSGRYGSTTVTATRQTLIGLFVGGFSSFMILRRYG